MKTMALIAAAILAGCGAETGDDTIPTPAPAPALDASVLAGRSLGHGALPQLQLLASRDGRDLMARVVSCALPRGTSITTITRDGTPYSFTGDVGLAPGWADHAPSNSERRRVSDCVRARSLPSTAA
jgi:hypothetical protein